MDEITVIVAAHQGDPWLKCCLESLEVVSSADSKIMIVDNGGNEKLLELVNATEDLSTIATPWTMPFSEANNFALINGGMDSEYICFLNQDTVSREDWLSACLDVMKQDEHIGAVIPLIENYDGTAWDEAFLTCSRADPALNARVREGLKVSVDDLPAFIEVPEITAAAMVVRTEALKKAGPFDPIYGSYYEDYDLCRRISSAGYKVGICTRARVGHFGGSATTNRQAFLRRARWIARNRIIYAARWKWKSRIGGFLKYISWEMPRNAARAALGRSAIPFRAFLRAHLDLVSILPRLLSAHRDKLAWSCYLRDIGWLAVVEQRSVQTSQTSSATR
ncbi:glycosyl transferase [Thermogutta terrifontis]|uniref:Glycosyl transferase n=1 Tax=Thermogutta terrifontis TaxID=1331910 RepID=A0A286RG79_9BACT|nr:glycosyltransferase family 2 protein [Thermogutta terrifontis]ASV74968.1 glycosyl transferase [Thermogutta terrifontis]